MPLAKEKGKDGVLSSVDAINATCEVLDYIRNFAAVLQNQKLIYVNPAGAKMLGFDDASSMLGKTFSDILHPSYKDIGSMEIAWLAEEDGLLIKFLRNAISSVDVHLWITALPAVGEDIYLLEAREMTKHLRSAADLQVREQRLQAVLNTVPDCILTIDENRRILSANPAAEREFCLAEEDLVHMDLAELVPHIRESALSSLLDSSWDRAYQKDKFWFGNRPNETFAVELVVRAIGEGQDALYTCIIRNVEERVLAEEESIRHMQDLEHNQQLLEGQASEALYLAEELEIQKSASEHLARHDPLTDLPNRRYFQDFLAESLLKAKKEATSVCLLFVDLDRFKEVNDTLGHNSGDELLLKVSSHLKKNTRNKDMVARLGGDEFAVVLNSEQLIDREAYDQIAERILQDLHIPVANGGETIQTSASIGAAIYPDHADNIDSLVKTADITMYKAKENGRNQVLFAAR